jgi:hypothetical protein
MVTSRMWNGGFWTKQSLKGAGPQRRLAHCNIEEVAAQFRLNPTTGMAFDPRHVNKRAARELVLDLFGPQRFPDPITVLTMPGSAWFFEAELLRNREGADRRGAESLDRLKGPERTDIHAVESDRAVYYECLTKTPGCRNRHNVIRDLGKCSFAERTLSFLWIGKYIFANMDDVMGETDQVYDCVWLDYFGPMTTDRMTLIKRFASTNIKHTFVITCLKGRWNPEVRSVLSNFGGYEEWIFSELSEIGQLEHCVNYFDTSPILQIAFNKKDCIQ